MRRLPLILAGLFMMGLSPFFFGMFMERQLTDTINRQLTGVGFNFDAGPLPDVEDLGRRVTKAFRNGTRVGVDVDGALLIYDIEVRKLGDLNLTSGKLVAADPFFAWTYGPLNVALPKGKFPVQVSIAYDSGTRQSSVAFAMLRLSEQKVVRWEIAKSGIMGMEEFEQYNLPAGLESYFAGYMVDSGNGSFMDADAAKVVVEDAGFEERLRGALEGSYADTISWANVTPGGASGANVITFSAGFGSGTYYTFAGYSADGNVAAVVTDFEVLAGMR
jgi:hypothetical protein